MKWPRFRLVWFVVLILLAGVDFCFIREDLLSVWGSPRWFYCSFSVGIMPMLNILIFGILVYQFYPPIRGFILGFEIIGMTLLGNYFAMVRADSWVVNSVVRMGNGYFSWALPEFLENHRFVFSSIATSLSITSIMVIIASVAGLTTRNFFDDDQRRPLEWPDGSEEEPVDLPSRPKIRPRSRSNSS